MGRKATYSLISLAVLFLTTSCESFLSRDPYDKISSDEFWRSEEDLELYSNGLLQTMLPSASTIARGSLNADCFALSVADDLLRPDGNVSSYTQTGWDESDWEKLRNINYMVENMHRCRKKVPESVYNHYLGVARFWRAWFYYDMVRTFGAVPWYGKTISSGDTEALNKARDSREYVMDRILEDLDFAAENCSDAEAYVKGAVYVNRWTALAFKSRVCLFEGTYRKYHKTDPSTGLPWDTGTYGTYGRFLEEAADAAGEIMDNGPFSVYTGSGQNSYRTLFTSSSLIPEEVIFGREYGSNVCHGVTWMYFSPTYTVCISLVKDFMDTYLMQDGTPFTDRENYRSIPYTGEFDGRDWRMAQTVVSPDYRMKINGTDSAYSPDWMVTRTGYQPIKWCIDDDSNGMFTSARSWNCLPMIRYAEVLLNYAEAEAELGKMDASVWNRTIAPLRGRAGVKSVLPSSPDGYLRDYFMDSEGALDKWILEVRRERGVELCLEMTLRWDDIMRWNLGKMLSSDTRQWKGLSVGDRNYSYSYTGRTDGAGNPVPDFSIGDEYTSTSIIVDDSGKDQSYTIDGDGSLVYVYAREWSDRKYLRPIPQSAIIRNPNLTQNPGWE